MYGQIIVRALPVLAKNSMFKNMLAKVSGIPASLKNSDFVSKITGWAAANPLKANAAFATSLSSVPSLLSSTFSDDEVAVIAAGIQEYYPGKDKLNLNPENINSIMGDRKPGVAGVDDEEIMKSAELIAEAIGRVNRISQILGIPTAQVGELVRLIQLTEPSDQKIFHRFK